MRLDPAPTAAAARFDGIEIDPDGNVIRFGSPMPASN
jgi:hypothetical protein